ncbi:MAG: HAD-IC family P-type ATPase, partial [Oscillospiraceae bacterium]|nr:HAD-IC family P-type ATPase [Oscillospiraceae bacterium]
SGTITEGELSIGGIFPNGVKEEDLLAVAAAAESHSRHPIAMMLKKAAGWTPDIAEGVMEVEEIPSRGVSAFIEGRHVYVGNAALLREHDVPFAVPSRSGAAVHVAVEDRYWGHIMIADKTREGAFDALESLRSQGVDQLVLLTGDVLSASRALASSLGFDLMRPELTTEGKVSTINYLIDGAGDHASVAYIGDGINDAPMLECADVGVAIDALDAWTEAEAADILILGNDLEMLPCAMRISRSLVRILWENICGLLGIKLLLLILALTTSLPIGLCAVIGTAATALALFNALRAFGLE